MNMKKLLLLTISLTALSTYCSDDEYDDGYDESYDYTEKQVAGTIEGCRNSSFIQ